MSNKCPIVIPDRVKRLPTWGRYPIPYFAHVDSSGVPDFRVFHHDHYRKAVLNRLCGICGDQLGRHLTFCGGFTQMVTRTFSDLSMHIECAIFAAQVCPFLNEEERDYSNRAYPEDRVVDRHIIQPVIKPRVNILYHCREYRIHVGPDGGTRLEAYDDFAPSRYFQSGQELTPLALQELVDRTAGRAINLLEFAHEVLITQAREFKTQEIKCPEIEISK